ncbi:MAG: translation elongation factor Ts [Leptonema illini]|jgi:elongation factor Ts|uniref:Elongation factor Ts n=2 Tax=Leptonema illini TaxID=183 RepID=H2CI80_9LEPT|nr:translation elongation factor Ts [Leptonema illini]EHQ04853.1 translation elongation factor Ts (EF-Ts) [Leptonema illini DSM 21528]KAB2929622.1 MAG: translation elongation factor Ts [Leptonema illini]
MYKASSDDIKKIRDMTGAGMMDCKKALEEFEGDMAKAVDELRKKGLAKAAKRMDRETSVGRVCSYIHGEGSIGAMIQLNCETDFVARNEDFAELGKALAIQIAAMNPLAIAPEDLDKTVEEREIEVIKEQLVSEGKKADQIEKILPGKLTKFYSEVCLLNQPFYKDDKKTVQEVIKDHIAKFGENITIGRFTRYQVG